VREVLAHGLDENEDAKHPRSTAARLFEFLGGGFWSSLRSGLSAGRSLREPREATDIACALEFLMSVRSRKSVCFLVSDFLDEGYEKALNAANRKHDVIAVLITDPRELELPGVGLVELRDAETGRTRIVDTGAAGFRREFEEQSRARIKSLERRLRGSGIDFIHIDASGSVVDPLVRFFRERERRQRR
jgi:uncharacterized protein (DUF58 family)